MKSIPATKDEFKKFVDAFADLGLVSDRTADNIQLACSALLPYIPEEQHAADWDLSSIASDFTEKSKVSEQTKKTYLSRFKSAVDKFIDYTEGKELKPVAKRRSPQKKTQEVVDDGVQTFELPIPLREKLIVKIDNLPRDLSVDEAERIANIIKSFAIA